MQQHCDDEGGILVPLYCPFQALSRACRLREWRRGGGGGRRSLRALCYPVRFSQYVPLHEVYHGQCEAEGQVAHAGG